jgi:Zn-dependent protease with chaperone function
VVPTCAGLALLAEYTVTISYAAPRFLLPTYALASIPAAQGLLWVAGFLARRWWRTLWLTVVAAMLAVQLVSQLAILDRYVLPVQRAIRLQYISVAQAVREQDLQPPCVLVGHTAAPIAFSAGCTDVPTISQAAQLEEAARRSDVGVLTTRRVAGVFYSGWPSYRLRAAHLRHRWYLYVHP